MLVVACLRVHNDVEQETFDVNLEDVVRMIDDPQTPGKYRSLIVTLHNREILDRHLHMAGFGDGPCR